MNIPDDHETPIAIRRAPDAVRLVLSKGIDLPSAGIAFIRDNCEMDMTEAAFKWHRGQIRQAAKLATLIPARLDELVKMAIKAKDDTIEPFDEPFLEAKYNNRAPTPEDADAVIPNYCLPEGMAALTRELLGLSVQYKVASTLVQIGRDPRPVLDVAVEIYDEDELLAEATNECPAMALAIATIIALEEAVGTTFG